MSRPAVPLRRAARLGVATAVSSRSVLAASTAWLVVLAAVYAADAGPPLPALAATAALLLPVCAWATAAHLAATSADLRQVLVAADGPVRTLAADAVPALLWLVAATAAGVVANIVADPHPAPLGARLLGALLHLLCGGVGAGVALALHAARVTRGVQALVVGAGSLPVPGCPGCHRPGRCSAVGVRGSSPAWHSPGGRSAARFW